MLSLGDPSNECSGNFLRDRPAPFLGLQIEGISHSSGSILAITGTDTSSIEFYTWDWDNFLYFEGLPKDFYCQFYVSWAGPSSASRWKLLTQTRVRHSAKLCIQWVCIWMSPYCIVWKLAGAGQVIEIITYFVGLLECCLALLQRIFLSFGGIIIQSYHEMGRWWFCKIKEWFTDILHKMHTK